MRILLGTAAVLCILAATPAHAATKLKTVLPAAKVIDSRYVVRGTATRATVADDVTGKQYAMTLPAGCAFIADIAGTTALVAGCAGFYELHLVDLVSGSDTRIPRDPSPPMSCDPAQSFELGREWVRDDCYDSHALVHYELLINRRTGEIARGASWALEESDAATEFSDIDDPGAARKPFVFCLGAKTGFETTPRWVARLNDTGGTWAGTCNQPHTVRLSRAQTSTVAFAARSKVLSAEVAAWGTQVGAGTPRGVITISARRVDRRTVSRWTLPAADALASTGNPVVEVTPRRVVVHVWGPWTGSSGNRLDTYEARLPASFAR